MDKDKLRKLRKKPYRTAYAKHKTLQGLAFQIKELRVARGLTQSQLAAKLGLRGQSAIARYEDPSYGKMSLQTLLRIAEVLDVALLTKFVGYSKFIFETHDVSPTALYAPSFEDEDAVGELDRVQAATANIEFKNAAMMVLTDLSSSQTYYPAISATTVEWSIPSINFEKLGDTSANQYTTDDRYAENC
ncbi:helix-turn-helix domain-containing protein [Caballeronia sp. DA-9]|uniref:helix-turn-helix domain-containing protein n=1 Tax=Caballeronia sp. DA-9 TaxID=3436237 RepID=UPI003F67B25B